MARKKRCGEMILDKLISKFKKNPHLTDKIKDVGLSDRTYHYLRKAGIVYCGRFDQVKMERPYRVSGSG